MIKKHDILCMRGVFCAVGNKIISAGVILTLLFNFGFMTTVQALTVEEAAGKKEKQHQRTYDEFSGKAPERRDDGSGHQEKDPRLACMLSLIVPGGGHIYLREDLKGIAFCLVTGTGYAASGYYLYLSLFGEGSSTELKSKMIISGLLFLVAAIVHVVGVVEAYNDAVQINEKRFYYGFYRSKSPYVAQIEYE